MPANILKGTLYAIGACFIWGLIFVVPLYMESFTPIEIALGRYLSYGSISSLILFRAYFQGGCRYPLSVWTRALCYSFICSIGYYTFVILAMRYSTPAICTLILGICPIAIAFYGNWRQKECSYRSLMMPSVLIAIGLVVINVPYILETPSPSTYLLGLVCALWALVAWSWYVVANSAFLKKNPHVDSGDWSTLMGVGTMFWVLNLGILSPFFFEDQLDWNKYFEPGPELYSFLIGSAILGILCSWVGGFLWNRASFYLPVSLAGQLTIFETLFGVSFVYMFEQRLPPKMEFLGVAFLLSAIIYGIRVSAKGKADSASVPV